MPTTPSFASKSRILALQADPHFQQYQEALRHYWRDDHQAALTLVSKALQGTVEHRFTPALYRLWVEILAEANDLPSLALLSEHLHARSCGTTWENDSHGLRGILWCERDYLEAAELLASTQLQGTPSSSWLEFKVKLAWRSGDARQEVATLLAQPDLVDYFQWSTLALGLQLNSVNEQLDTVLAQVSRLFPEAPLEHLYKAHRLIDQGNFKAAKRHSLILLQQYPHHLDRQILHSFILLNLGETTAAVNQLKRAQATKKGREDGDVYALLSYAYRHLYHSSKGQELAKRCLARAEQLYQRLGISCEELRLPFQERGALPAGKTGNLLYFAQASRSIHSWLVQGGPSEFSWILNAEIAALTYRKQQLSSSAKTNDLVFIASPHPWHDDQQRILALYFVVGLAGGERGKRGMANLKLVKRFTAPLAVTLPLNELRNKTSKREVIDRGEPCQIFHLHPQHLGMINQEISALLQDNHKAQRWAKSS